jgi:hypothetical protein
MVYNMVERMAFDLGYRMVGMTDMITADAMGTRKVVAWEHWTVESLVASMVSKRDNVLVVVTVVK